VKKIPPSHILGVTFTNKAADEMKNRIKAISNRHIKNLTIATFHSLGVRILRKHIAKLGYGSRFTIQDEDDSKNLVRNILAELKIKDDKKFELNSIIRLISFAKNSGLDENYFKSLDDAELRLVMKKIFESYREKLFNYNSVDFDDLILLPLKLLRDSKNIRQDYQELFKYILVDEYQDTNNIQYSFLKLLVSPERNICCVGDDDQAIYGFRGSKVEHILKFERDFPDPAVIKLEEITGRPLR